MSAFRITFALLAILSCVIVFSPRYLPCQDFPNHVAITRGLMDLAAGDETANRFYASTLGLKPYHGYYLLARALGSVAGADVANRILIAIAVLGIPLSLCLLLVALDPEKKWLSLLGFGLAFSDIYFVGFAGFLLAIPCMLVSWALCVRLVRSTEVGLGPVLAMNGALLLAWLLHPFAAMLGLGGIGVLGIALTRDLRLLTRLVAGALPMGLATLAWVLSSPVASRASRLPMVFKIEYFARTPVFGPDCAGALPLAVAALALGVFAGCGLHAALRARARPAFAPSLLALALLGVFLAAPFAAGSVVWLDLRVAPVAWLAIVAALPAAWVSTRLARGAVVAAAGAALAGVLVCHVRFDREMAPLSNVIEAMPAGRRVLPIVADPSSAACRPFYARSGRIPFYSPYAHFASYGIAQKGGITPFVTFHPKLRWIPLRLRDPYYEAEFSIAEPFRPKALLERLPALAPHFDVILVRGVDDAAATRLDAVAKRIAEDGAFSLYVVTPPR
jgi:hypothetical protein